jgi:hypothetical protein
MRRQAPNSWVSQRLFGGRDPRACVGKVLHTFAHHAPFCILINPAQDLFPTQRES